MTEAELPRVVHDLKKRIDREVPEAKAAEMLAATYVLMGLRYDKGIIGALRREVLNMEESIIYQEIKGIGMVEEARRMLVMAAEHRLGRPSRPVQRKLDGITDRQRLEALVRKVHEADSWTDLLAGG